MEEITLFATPFTFLQLRALITFFPSYSRFDSKYLLLSFAFLLAADVTPVAVVALVFEPVAEVPSSEVAAILRIIPIPLLLFALSPCLTVVMLLFRGCRMFLLSLCLFC